MKTIQTITVIGAGTMGNGIAHTFAQNGYKVFLNDISSSALDQALTNIETNLDRLLAKDKITIENKTNTLEKITTTVDLKQAVASADLVVEAATESLELKLKIFESLDDYCSDSTILATNTSSISITKIATALQQPERLIGMHFMNPVPIMPLVEVIKGYNTSEAVLDQIMTLCESLNKIPVEVADYPGFIANRILMPMINEAIESLFQGVAGVKEIDSVMKLGMAHPMGPLQLADFIGLDVCLFIMNVLYEGFKNPKYAPCPLLVNMVTAGKLGVKTGEGFYNYETTRKAEFVAKQFS